MLYRLMSLVVLLVSLNIPLAYSAENVFIFPKDKPSIFKKIEKQSPVLTREVLPIKKPIVKKKEDPKITDKLVVSENSKKIKKTTFKFILPAKKPISYKIVKSEKKNSEILNKKDFDKAKSVFKLIKAILEPILDFYSAVPIQISLPRITP